VAPYARVGQDLQPVSQQPHFFDRVPLIDFQNNRELLGDFEKHESLIDGYDRLVSDAQNEIEEFRQAYLIFKGVTPDAETIKQAKESGAFGCEKEDSIEYLTKQINDQFVENQKKTLRENIYRFSKTVDVNADTFTGSGASGEARKWLLLALENRGSKMALKFQSGTHRMFRVLSSSWKRKAIGIEPDAIEVTLDRNLPVELKTEAEIQQALNGVVSNRTRLKLFSPVKDVDAEMKEMEEENDLKINLDDVPTDDPQKTKDQQSVQDGIMTQEEFDAKWGTAQ
jgi:SPP1 family phage portal protein